MGKSESVKKHKWLWLSLGALVLAAAIILGIFLLGGNSETKTEKSQRIVLYWNVDRMDYLGKGIEGASMRTLRSDGYYYIRFAVGGEQVDYPVANDALVQKIDQLDVVGLEFDDNGVVVGVKNINECTGGLVANVLYVASIDGNTIHCNNQAMLKGQEVTLKLTDSTEIYDVGQGGLLCGIPSQVEVDDELMAIKDYDGNIIYIFRRGCAEPGDVYWNLDRKYDSTNKMSTREYDEMGTYEFRMALNGEIVTVKTRDMKIANAIDAKAARCTGLEFDEDGYVSRVYSATQAANGSSTFASWAHVFETDGLNVYAVKLSGSAIGTEYQAPLAKNCKIINVSGVGGELGSYTTIQYGDQIHGLLDKRGRICYAWIVARLSGGDGYQLYWNLERKYDKELKQTTRTPAADGYYYIDLATGGKQVTVKTRDREMATKLDSYAARCFAMKVSQSNEIEAFASAGSIHGGSTFGSWYYVDKIDGNNLTVSRILSGDTEPTVMEGAMHEDVEIINGSASFKNNPGEYTTLKVGDRIHGLRDLDGKIRVIFVVERAVSGPVYWNITRQYDTKAKVSTRKPAADGYYYFEMAAGGKQVTLKTKDKELVNKIDAAAARCMGLTVDKNNVILKYHTVSTVEGCQGGTKSESWVDVKKLNGRTYTAQKDPDSNVATAGQYFSSTMAANCKVYNVSSNYNSFCGEPTTLRVGDTIHVLHNKEGDATWIFVVGRNKTLNEKDSCPCQNNVKWIPWNGRTPLENGKYYSLTTDVVAPKEGFLLENIAVSIRLNGHTISSQGRCFYLKSGSRLNICDHTTRGKLIGNGVAEESGGVIRSASSSSTVNLWNVDVIGGDAGVAKEGGLISCSGTVSVYNCNLLGGTATSKGGNVQLSSSGTFRMFGGTVAGGKAPASPNINAAGRMYLENVTVADSGSVTCNSDKEIVINGLTAKNVNVIKNSVTLKGSLHLEKLNVREKGILVDGGIFPESHIVLTNQPVKSQIVMTSATLAGYKAMTTPDPEDYAVVYNKTKKTVSLVCTIVPQTHNNSHCACAGVANGVGEHVCQDLTKWTKLTADILVDSPTSGNLAFPASGNYYLSVDVNLTKSIDILPGQEITLCLNSCDLTSSKRIFRINGTLNITDCQNKGKLIGESALAPVFYTYAGGVFNLYGGTLTTEYSGNSGYWGGIGAVSTDAGNAAAKGTSAMNMYGGTIKGSSVIMDKDGKYGQGGAFCIYGANTFTMYGGVITGGSAGVHGGNIFTSGAAKLKLLGGQILTGDVYVEKQAEVTLGGDVRIDDLHLADCAPMTLEDLSKDADIALRMTTPGVFAYAAEDMSSCFYSLDVNIPIVYANGKLKLEPVLPEGSHAHCICGNTAEGLYDHECERTLYQAWESTNSLPTESGSYYLTGDVVLADWKDGLKLGTNSINICLNGFNITNPEGRVFYINGAGALNVCNCDTDKGGVISGTGVAGESGGLVRISLASGKFGAYNVTLRRTDTETPVAVTEGGVINCSGSLRLYGCTVENGYSSKGGNLNMVLTSKSVVVGCTIKNGKVEKDAKGNNGTGGNIRIGGNNADNPASLVLMDTVLTGGQAQVSGASLYMADATATRVTMGGLVTMEGIMQMAGNDNLTLQDLSADSSIRLKMSNPGNIGSANADVSGCFRSATAGLKVYFDADQSKLYMDADADMHSHCFCGDTAEDLYDHTCGNQIYQAWESTNSLPTESGSYYLTGNVILEDMPDGLMVGTNQINICLNGYHITNENGRVFYLKNSGGALHVCNCNTEKGGVIGATGVAGESGGVVRLGSTGASFGAYNVTLRRIDTDTRVGVTEGGVINCSGKLWLYNCCIENGYAFMGGNLNIVSTAQAVVENCTITGGHAAKDSNHANGVGGNLRIAGNNSSNPATLYLKNTVVENSYAQAGGAGLYMGDAAKTQVTISGRVTMDGVLYMLGASNLRAENLSTDSAIRISMKTAGVIGKADADVASCFQSAVSDMQVFYDAAAKELYMAAQPREEEPEQTHKAHCLCAGAQFLPEELEHTCQNVNWVALTQALFDGATENSTPVSTDGTYYYLATGGYYYLEEDVSLSKSIAAAPTDVVYLCLNGKNLHGQARTLYFQGSLHLCDCVYTDEVVEEQTIRTYSGTVTSASKGHAHIFYARSGASFYLYGGNLIGHAVGSSYTSNSGTGIVGGTMYMYGGVIRDGDTTANKKGGGNIRVEGVFEMYAGLITEGKANEGGNISIASAGSVVLCGGVVEKGRAVSGGNIAVFGALTVADQAVISDGISTGSASGNGGGNIYGYPNKTNIRMTGGQILNGQAAKVGANIYVRGNSNGTNTASLSFTGGQVSGVSAGSASGVTSVYLQKNKGVLNITVGGDAQVDNILMDTEGMLKLATVGITEAASVGVSLTGGNGTVISQLDTDAVVDYTKIFHASVTGKTVKVVDGTLVITE